LDFFFGDFVVKSSFIEGFGNPKGDEPISSPAPHHVSQAGRKGHRVSNSSSNSNGRKHKGVKSSRRTKKLFLGVYVLLSKVKSMEELTLVGRIHGQ
jgi:hypothetical protein